MPSISIVSNGHGEDVIGASLAITLRELAPALRLRAFPLVDDGEPYGSAGVERLGPCRVMPSGGFTMHSPSNLVADLRAGFASMTVAQLAALAGLRSDVLVIVGDVYAQALGAFSRASFRAVMQPLVSAYHASEGGTPPPNRYFMERISYPERALMRHLANVVYTRDEPTAAWLRAHGVSQALALGNPMVDRAAGRPMPVLHGRQVVALLPGTRAHTPLALQRMAEALTHLEDVTGLVAWSGGALPALAGWSEDQGAPAVAGRVRALKCGSNRLWVLEGRFGVVLASAQVALGTAGTANEQAAARGVPVVSFAVPPYYTPAYLANQKRLLGEALILSRGDAAEVAAAVRALLVDEAARERASRAGRSRMGAPGGSRAIARDLLARVARTVPAFRA